MNTSQIKRAFRKIFGKGDPKITDGFNSVVAIDGTNSLYVDAQDNLLHVCVYRKGALFVEDTGCDFNELISKVCVKDRVLRGLDIESPIPHIETYLAHREPVGGLSPGIAHLVNRLRVKGWNTTDSGDGTGYSSGMENAIDAKHVFITYYAPARSSGRWANIVKLLNDDVWEIEGSEDATVEMSWSPDTEILVLLVWP